MINVANHDAIAYDTSTLSHYAFAAAAGAVATDAAAGTAVGAATAAGLSTAAMAAIGAGVVAVGAVAASSGGGAGAATAEPTLSQLLDGHTFYDFNIDKDSNGNSIGNGYVETIKFSNGKIYVSWNENGSPQSYELSYVVNGNTITITDGSGITDTVTYDSKDASSLHFTDSAVSFPLYYTMSDAQHAVDSFNSTPTGAIIG